MLQKQPNYWPVLARMIARGDFADLRGGDVLHIEVLHDLWCGVWPGHICDCKPEIRIGNLEMCGQPVITARGDGRLN